MLTSDDTAHGLRIEGTDVDLTIPKRGRGEIRVTVSFDKAGRYEFACSRMCGAGHNYMRGEIARPRVSGATIMRTRVLLSLALLAWFGVARYVATISAQGASQAGDPLAGLTPQQFAEFRLGLDDFLEVETPDDGLGPAFNGTSCAACHNVPTVGGAGILLETRVGYQQRRRGRSARSTRQATR